MAAKTREIKSRIKAVANIQRITKTMQMIATARFQAAQRNATAARPYTQKICELVAELASAGGSVSLPLLGTRDPEVGLDSSNRLLLLVITANRGLCGAYNANLHRAAMNFRREHHDEPIDLEVVGKKGNAFFKFNRIPVAAFHSQFTDKATYEQVEELAQRHLDAFTSGLYAAVHVVYMAFHSLGQQSPEVLKLLPLENPRPDAPKDGPRVQVQYDFSPEPNQLLDELLPIMVKTRLFQCFNEAVVGEQLARMVAMKAATDAAGKMGKLLNRQYNRARQTAITTELTEIMGGAAGLQ